jgi:hypothetical protein
LEKTKILYNKKKDGIIYIMTEREKRKREREKFQNLMFEYYHLQWCMGIYTFYYPLRNSKE